MTLTYVALKHKIKKATTKDQVPTVPHYALLSFESESVRVPGDERSRTNPGHGYPEHTVTHDTFQYYYSTDLDQMQAFVAAIHDEGRKRTFDQKNDFVVIHVDKILGVKTEVKLQ